MSAESATFPNGFIWGAATSAYQIEGASEDDGRGSSIWDTFCRESGKIRDGSSGAVAADHYHRWREDTEIMAGLGLKAYRFSISWPRILPQGKGPVNRLGLDFYDRLVDDLLAKGIEPFPTLYHWDLPQALEDEGGWTRRETAEHFAEYARIMAERLGDRVGAWVTHNEPIVAAYAGYMMGEHAPGLRDPVASFQALHHLLLSHGLAVEALKAGASRPIRVGIVLNLQPVHPASQAEADVSAARRFDAAVNGVTLEPVFHRRYPEALAPILVPVLPAGVQDDLDRIGAPLDFLGINYYTRAVIGFDPDSLVIQAAQHYPQGREYSQMWEVYPEGLGEVLESVWTHYTGEGGTPILITENGIPVPDGVDFDGRVRDTRRIRYLRDHLGQVLHALAKGIPVRGYFAWSLMDNFEWAHGYQMRFGLVYVDYSTQARSIKESGRWYARVIQENRLPAETDA
jgi:beta-glucosidase